MDEQTESKVISKNIYSALQKIGQALLDSLGLSETLQLILEQLSQVIEFDSASIMLIRDNHLKMVAQQGFRSDSQYFSYKKLEKLQHIQKVLRDCVPEIILDNTKDERWHQLLDSKYIKCWLGVPLIVKGNAIGILNIDKEQPNFYTESHAGLAMAFANQAAIAIENARLLQETRQKTDSLEATTDHLKRLVASSFDGIITIDLDGIIIDFNAKAEEILGCKAAEMVGKSVSDDVYADSHEARRIGKLLHKNSDGRLVNYETYVKSRHGDKIPILLSATWLFDAKGNKIGSVGYFKDMRSIQITERRLQKLLEANNAVAQAENQVDGLHNLAKIMVESLIASFCYVLLLDSSGENLVARAAYPYPRNNGLAWDPQIGKICRPFGAVEISEPLKKLQPSILLTGEKFQVDVIHHIEKEVGLQGSLQSVLIVPIIVGEKSLGFCILGEMRNWERSPIDEEKIKFAQSLTAQVAVLIDRVQLFHEADHRAHNLETLQELAITISSSLDLDKTLRQTCQSAVEFFDVDHSGLVLFDPDLIRGRVAAEYPVDVLERTGTVIPLRGVPLEEKLIETREPVVVHDVENEADLGPVRNILYEQFGICSVLIVPVESKGELLGSFSLDAVEHKHQFTPEEIEFCKIFAAQVASAVENARLFHETDQRRQLLAALDEASRHIRAEKEPQKLLHEIVRLAADLVGCKAGCLFINHPYSKELEMTVGYGLLEGLPKSRLPYSDSFIGEVAQTGVSKVVDHNTNQADQETIFNSIPLEKAIGVPLKQAGEVNAVLLVADDTSERQCTNDELEILERYADQAAIALRTSQLMNLEQRRLSQLGILHRISDYIQRAKDLNNILHVVLTGVTAGYGLGFNRAALLLLDDQKKYLFGQMGIGYLEKERAIEDWAHHHLYGMEDFDHYLEEMEQGSLQSTPVGEKILGLQLPLNLTVSNLLTEVVLERGCILGTEKGLSSLPGAFIEAFEPALPFIVVPLIAREQVIGILIADNKFTQTPVTDEDTEALITFANSAAVAIDNTQLLHDAEAAREKLHSFYKASNTLISSPASKRILRDIVEQAQTAAEAAWVSIILIDEMGRARNPITTGLDHQIDIKKVIRPDGITMQVMRTGNTEIIEDTNLQRDRVNPRMFSNNVAAALCMPVSIKGKRIGVMWIHYNRPRHFPQFEINAAQLYVNQAAIAYENARQMEELEHMRQAAEALSGAASLRDVLKHIVDSARDVLRADSAAIRSYDTVRHRFLPESSIAVGIPTKLWEKFRKDEPRERGTVYKIMNESWIGVKDIADVKQYPFLGESTRELLSQIGAMSFQGVVLATGNEKLGVLYVNYNFRHSFSREEQETTIAFANHAALALKRAQLLDQVNKAHNTARLVAEVTVLGELRTTLDSIVSGTSDALRCDAVTLYSYDQDRGEVGYPPAMFGVMHPKGALRFGRVAKNSIIRKILTRDDLHVAENAPNDPLMGGPFVKREKIASSVGIPLITRRRKVGVMFINYRSHHRFTDVEITNIKLFADQAATAIRNSQLFQAQQQHAETLRVIQTTSAAVSAVLDINELLPMITEKAAKIFNAHAASLMLWDRLQKNLVIKSAYGLGKSYQENQQISQANVEKIIQRKKLESLVININDHPIGNSNLIKSEGLHTVLVAPLVINNKLIGVLNIYSKDRPRRFTKGEKELAMIFANHAYTAIHNAQLYEQEQKRIKALEALHESIHIVTSSFTLDEMLSSILEQAWNLIGVHDRAALFSHISLIEETRLIFAETYPPEHLTDLREKIGELDLKNEIKPRGIIVRSVKEKKSQLIEDVTQDPDYIEYNPLVRSQLAVPIIINDEVIGVINLDHKKPKAFDEDDKQILETLASHVGIAIHKTQILEQNQRRSKLLFSASAVSNDATAILDVDKLLTETVNRVAETFGFYHAGVFLLDDKKEYAVLKAVSSEEGKHMLENGHKLKVGEEGIVGHVTRMGKPRISNNVFIDPVHFDNPILPETQVEMAFPLITHEQIIGALDVQSTIPLNFADEDLAALQMMVDQLASAINNAQLYEERSKRAIALQALYEAGKVITRSLTLDEILNHIAEQAWTLTGQDGKPANFVNISLIEEQTIRFVAVFPTGEMPKILDTLGPKINLNNDQKQKIGVTGRAILEGYSQLVEDVSQNSDYLESHPETRSELTVPIKHGEEIIGVINAEHSEPDAFTKEDQEGLMLLAAQAAVAIQNAKQFEYLKKVRGLVGSKTATDWMRMVSTAWGHAVIREARIAKNYLELIQQDILDGNLLQVQEDLFKCLGVIDRIKEIPIIAPLSAEDVIGSVRINELIKKYLSRVWEREPYKSISLIPNFQHDLDNIVSTRVSPEWIRRALEILIDNAVFAMSKTNDKIKKIEVTTRLLDRTIEIYIKDNGPGITPSILSQVFNFPIKKSPGSPGAGLGLMLAKNIVQTFDGDLSIHSTGDDGTTMLILLPAESKK